MSRPHPAGSEQPDISVQPTVFQKFTELLAAQSIRHGGVSAPPFDSLNLGTAAGDNPAAVRENRARLLAAVGISPDRLATCIGADSFEVDADVADHFAPGFKKWDAAKGKFLIDLKAANVRQLSNFGIPVAQVEVSPHCTVQHNADYFSYRREGRVSGRTLALIGTRP